MTYTKVGSLVPSSSDRNFPGAPTVVYPNDPSDATKVTRAGVPTVPGYTAHDPEGHVLTRYQPSDPTKDTTITYTADKQKGSSNQPGNPSQPSNATNNGVINTSTNTGSKVNNGAVNSPELHQTSENNSQSQTRSFIGILLAMFVSLLGFLGIKITIK
ncbi:hypothetical protein [Lactobacillus helveticus]|uniref:hypothetical protein n=1 Tax=Lactobacillus helveticus TaxID=1587 RepID=UPI00187B4EC3